MKWAAPDSEADSALDPVATQMPRAAERTEEMGSVRMRTPFGRVSIWYWDMGLFLSRQKWVISAVSAPVLDKIVNRIGQDAEHHCKHKNPNSLPFGDLRRPKAGNCV